jgi:ribosomal protein S18 acetylase RimI-like enzyme
MTNLSIRAAATGEARALAELNAHVQQLHVAHRPDVFKVANTTHVAAWFESLQADPSARIWIAEAGGVPVGYVLVLLREATENAFIKARRWWEVDQIGVAESHRRSGVARALLEHVVAEARAHGIADLELQTWAFNQGAQSAFHQLGFKPQRARHELHIGAKFPLKS